jgi:hypothetical protein
MTKRGDQKNPAHSIDQSGSHRNCVDGGDQILDQPENWHDNFG